MTVQPGLRMRGRVPLRAVPDTAPFAGASGQYAPPRFPPDLVGLDDAQDRLDRLAQIGEPTHIDDRRDARASAPVARAVERE